MSTAMTSLRSRNFVNVLTDELLPHCSDAVRDRVLTQCHLDFRSGLPTCCVNSRPSATSQLQAFGYQVQLTEATA